MLRYLVLATAVVLVAGCQSRNPRKIVAPSERSSLEQTQTRERELEDLSPLQRKIVSGALRQADEQAVYDASYRNIPYPGGDVPRTQGACTDVVIRAFRDGGIDLQRLIFVDAKRRPGDYPNQQGKLDPNILHRRVKNMVVFFNALKTAKSTELAESNWKPGDIVVWRVYGSQLHVGICSNLRNDQGLPYVVHNIQYCAEQDVLTAWPIVAHFRVREATDGLRG